MQAIWCLTTLGRYLFGSSAAVMPGTSATVLSPSYLELHTLHLTLLNCLGLITVCASLQSPPLTCYSVAGENGLEGASCSLLGCSRLTAACPICRLPLICYSIVGDEQHVKAETRRLLEQTAAPNNALVALLSAVPFGCAAAVMLLNAKHSQATGGSPAADYRHASWSSH